MSISQYDVDTRELLEKHIEQFDEFADKINNGEIEFPNGKTMAELAVEHDQVLKGQEDILTFIAGPKNPITEIRDGGLKADVEAIRHAGENGGVNAKVKFSTGQKVALWLVAVPAIGAGVVRFLELLQSMIENT